LAYKAIKCDGDFNSMDIDGKDTKRSSLKKLTAEVLGYGLILRHV